MSNNTGDSKSSNRRTVSSNLITELTQNDILFGRGAPIINYEGNVRFRELVRSRKQEYNSTGRHQIKDEIARQIVVEVTRRNGRFLRKIESEDKVAKHQMGINDDGEPVWTIADDSVILEKVKQALRDKESERRLAARSDSSSQNAAASGEVSIDTKINIGTALQVSHTQEANRWPGPWDEHPPLLSNSVYRQVGLSSLLPQSLSRTHPSAMSSELPDPVVSLANQSANDLLRRLQQQHILNQQEHSLISRITAGRNTISRELPHPIASLTNQSESDLLRRQQQQQNTRNQQGGSLISRLHTGRNFLSNSYLQSLLQQSQIISLPSMSSQDGRISLDALLSTLNVQNRSRDAATNLQLSSANSQNLEAALRTLQRLNPSEIAGRPSTIDLASMMMGPSTSSTPSWSDSLRQLQQQQQYSTTAAITTPQEPHGNHMQMRQRLLDPANLQAATNFASTERWNPKRRSRDTILLAASAASLPIEHPPRSHDTVLNSRPPAVDGLQAARSIQLGDSQPEDYASLERRSNNNNHKRNATELSGASSTDVREAMTKRNNKPRVTKNPK